MRVLVTGISGFAGSHLAELVLDQPAELHGTVLSRVSVPALGRRLEQVHVHRLDLTDLAATRDLLSRVAPDWIFHLAGWSAVGEAWEHRAEALRINVQTTFSLLEGLRALKLPARVLLVSSGAVYGAVPETRQPIHEEMPLRPLTPYALSKACLELYAVHYALGEGLDIVTVRAFNHFGPRQRPGFVSSDLARKIVEIEEGRTEALQVGNLEARRDFTDVRDIVRAYWLALRHGERGEIYNIASGKAVSVREIVDGLCALSHRPIQVRPDPRRQRRNDLSVLVGDPTKFRTLTGWTPEIPLERTLADILEDWRQRDAS